MFFGDPGRCPVDDAPHTTCTSPDYGPIVIPQLPMRDLMAVEADAVTPAPPMSTSTTGPTFTTKTYRRKKP